MLRQQTQLDHDASEPEVNRLKKEGGIYAYDCNYLKQVHLAGQVVFHKYVVLFACLKLSSTAEMKVVTLGQGSQLKN